MVIYLDLVKTHYCQLGLDKGLFIKIPTLILNDIDIKNFYCNDLYIMFYKNNGDLMASGAHQIVIRRYLKLYIKMWT